MSNIKVPYRSFIHDFAITENYILVPIFPCIVNYEAAKLNPDQGVFQWQPERGSYVLVLDKNTHKTISCFDVDIIHLETGKKIGDDSDCFMAK